MDDPFYHKLHEQLCDKSSLKINAFNQEKLIFQLVKFRLTSLNAKVIEEQWIVKWFAIKIFFVIDWLFS